MKARDGESRARGYRVRVSEDDVVKADMGKAMHGAQADALFHAVIPVR